MSDNHHDQTANRRALGDELEGLEGLVYRISTTLDPEAMHAASLNVVCEAIYLARQVMHNDAVDPHDVDDLMEAVARLERKGLEWKVNSLQNDVWSYLPERLRPESGPTRKALEFALHEWLSQNELEGKTSEQLAEGFAEFCDVTAG
jgi:hypothetical protein